MAVSFTKTDSDPNGAISSDTFTVSDMSLGSDDGNPVIVFLAWFNSATGQTTKHISSLTVAGATGTKIDSIVDSGPHWEIDAWIAYPSGTSGDLVAVFDTTADGEGVVYATYKIIGADPTNPVQTTAKTSSVTGTSPLETSVDIPANGGVLVHNRGPFGPTFTAVGYTDDSDAGKFENIYGAYGGFTTATVVTGHTVGVTWTGIVVDVGAALLAVIVQPPITAFDVGTFALDGQNTTFLYDRVFPVVAGNFEFTGQDAGSLYDHDIKAAFGAFTLTGFMISNAVTTLIDIGLGTFVLSGEAATIISQRKLSLVDNAYGFVGESATFRIVRKWHSESSDSVTWTPQGSEAVAWAPESAVSGSWESEI